MSDVLRLRPYFSASSNKKKVTKREILDDVHALRALGEVWGNHQSAIMAMMAAIEYDFITSYNYTEEQVVILKKTLGDVGMFLKGCGEEWDAIRVAVEKSRKLEK